MEDFKLRLLDFFKTLFIMLLCLGFLSVIYFFILPKLALSLPSINRESEQLKIVKNENPDKDNDGLVNSDEVNLYGTNPDNADSNGDGIKDGDEIYKEWESGIISNSTKVFSYKSNIIQHGIHSLKEELDLKATAIYKPYSRISPLIMTHITIAFNFRKENKLQDSVDQLEKIIKLDSNSGVAFHHLGLTYFAMGDFNKALDYYRKALGDNNFKSPFLYHDLFVTSLRLGLKNDAINYLEAGMKDFPNYLRFYSQAANYYIDNNNLVVAENTINKGIVIEPRYPEFFNELGLIYDKQGDKQKALEFYKKAVSVDLHYALANMNISILYREDLNDPTSALTEALISDEFNPTKLSFSYQENLNDEQKAVIQASVANEYASKYSHIKNALGLAYEANGNSDKAIVEYKKAIELDPLYDKAYNNIGISYATKKQYDLAEQSFKKAIETNSEYTSAYNNLGYLYIEQGKYSESLSYLKKASNLDQNWFLPHQNLGYAYFYMKNNKEAVKEWEKAVSLGMTNDEVIRVLKSIKR